MARFLRSLYRARATLLECVGFLAVAAGIYQMCASAALIVAGAALVFVAQGMEGEE